MTESESTLIEQVMTFALEFANDLARLSMEKSDPEVNNGAIPILGQMLGHMIMVKALEGLVPADQRLRAYETVNKVASTMVPMMVEKIKNRPVA